MFLKLDPQRVGVLKELTTKLALVVAMAVLLVLLPVLLPVVLLRVVVLERLRRCLKCGRRGTLRDVSPPPPPAPTSAEDTWETWVIPRSPRVTPQVFRCQDCGASFEAMDGEPLRQVSADPSPW